MIISPDSHWYRLSWLSLVLLPAGALFRVVVAVRRLAYRWKLLPQLHPGAPVIVVGNITAGGAGKTPLVIWLCDVLRRHGHRPGIVSRGYGGARAFREVTGTSDPAEAGDEPVLLALRTGCPVWIGTDRAAAARALLAAHPDCTVVVSDDGLQHYRLARDVEIAVVDGDRGLGNGLPLPAGPLREPASRLDEVDAVVVNGREDAMPGRFHMTLEGTLFRNLANPAETWPAAGFTGKRVHAIAGIGNPGRFFRHLRSLGMAFIPHPFPDHHPFVAGDLAFAEAEAIVMTEKDAIKCRRFARGDHWVLAVDARVDGGLDSLLLDKLDKAHGP